MSKFHSVGFTVPVFLASCQSVLSVWIFPLIALALHSKLTVPTVITGSPSLFCYCIAICCCIVLLCFCIVLWFVGQLHALCYPSSLLLVPNIASICLTHVLLRWEIHHPSTIYTASVEVTLPLLASTIKKLDVRGYPPFENLIRLRNI